MTSSHFEKNPSNTIQITIKVVYHYKRGLNGRITNCRLALHSKCFDELRKMDDCVRKVRNRKNESMSNGTLMTLLYEKKMCCHHSLKDLQVHTDSAWFKKV